MLKVALILGISFVLLLSLKVPIAYSLGIGSFICLIVTGFDPVFMVQNLFNANNSFTLLAVPFFILAGDLMLAGGVSERLVNFVRTMMGNVTGALAIVCVIACMIFAAISGSGPATVAAMGGIMIPAMVKENYDAAFSSSIASAAGSLGPVIPPSVIFVMYGVTVGASIGELFIAGLIPGIIIGLVLIIYSIIKAKKENWGEQRPKASGKEKLLAFKDAIWALLVPLIILGGIYSGIFTPTEAAVVACVYAIIVGFFVYREMTIKILYKTICKSTLTLGAAIIIMAFAASFGKVLTIAQIPQALTTFFASVTSNKFVFLLIINVFLFFVGMIMETLSAVVIIAPLLYPVAVMYGIDPVHLGVVMTINLALGLCTPPVGVNTYVASQIGRVKIEEMIKPLLPIVALMFITVLLISFVEPLTMLLPRMLRG